jgi:small-conductance mechanosensitive channel
MISPYLLQPPIRNFILAGVTLGVGILLAKFLSDFLRDFLKKEEVMRKLRELGYEEPVVDLIIFALRYAIYVIAFIVALAQFGFGVIVLQLIAIVSLAIIAFVILYSIRDFIPNAASGIYIHRSKLIKIGDEIDVDGFKGRVVEVGLLVTTLKDEEGKLMIIPNSLLTKRKIIKKEAEFKSRGN